jgi:antitoxin component YwqK of YwqJK toxin-antitoxin module
MEINRKILPAFCIAIALVSGFAKTKPAKVMSDSSIPKSIVIKGAISPQSFVCKLENAAKDLYVIHSYKNGFYIITKTSGKTQRVIDSTSYQQVNDTLFMANGWSFGYFLTGEKYSYGCYKNGVEEGPWLYFSKNGFIFRMWTYVDGSKEGQYCGYYPSGKILAIGNYKYNRMDGDWIVFHENGAIKEKGKYFSSSDYIEYFSPATKVSTIDAEYVLSNDIKTGEWEYWDTAGVLIKTEVYDRGRLLK